MGRFLFLPNRKCFIRCRRKSISRKGYQKNGLWQ